MDRDVARNSSILHPFNKLPDLNSAVILLVGFQSIKKQELARSIVELSTHFSLQVRTAAQLPLPSSSNDQRPKIDLVVFMLDANIKQSMKTVADSVKHLDAAYFLGRVCFVALNATDEKSHCADLGDILALCDAYDSPLLCGDLETKEERNRLARRLVEMTKIAAGFQNGVSPLLVQSTKRSYQFVETL